MCIRDSRDLAHERIANRIERPHQIPGFFYVEISADGVTGGEINVSGRPLVNGPAVERAPGQPPRFEDLRFGERRHKQRLRCKDEKAPIDPRMAAPYNAASAAT